MEKIRDIEVRDVLAVAGRERLRLVLEFTGTDGDRVAVRVPEGGMQGHSDEIIMVAGSEYKVLFFAFEATADDGTTYRVKIVYRTVGRPDEVGTWVVDEQHVQYAKRRTRRVGRQSDPTDLLSTG
jgi:hypothetical protein